MKQSQLNIFVMTLDKVIIHLHKLRRRCSWNPTLISSWFHQNCVCVPVHSGWTHSRLLRHRLCSNRPRENQREEKRLKGEFNAFLSKALPRLFAELSILSLSLHHKYASATVIQERETVLSYHVYHTFFLTSFSLYAFNSIYFAYWDVYLSSSDFVFLNQPITCPPCYKKNDIVIFKVDLRG